MKKHYEQLLKDLTHLCSVSGYNQDIATRILKEAKDRGISLRGADSLGSVSLNIPARSPVPTLSKKIMVCAHQDSPGYIVAKANDQKLDLVKVGMPNVIGVIPGWLQTKTKIIPVTIVDEGNEEPKAKSYVDDLDDLPLIRIGDPVFFADKVVSKPRGKFTGPALDNKAGIVAVFMAIDKLLKMNTQHHLFFVFPTLEEVDAQGARTAAEKIKPAFVINVDTYESTGKLSRGPAIHRGPVFNHVLVDRLEKTAIKYKIPYLFECLFERANSDVDVMLKSNGGTPCCEIGIPCNNIHSNEEQLSKKDIDLASRLIAHTCMDIELDIDLVSGGLNGM